MMDYFTKEARNKAIAQAKQLIDEKPVYLDTETTGLSPQDEIVEIAIIDHDGTVLFDELVKPSRDIPSDATRIHGITNDMVVRVRSWPAHWPEIRRILIGRRIGIYNADFDLRMMKQSYERYQLAWRENLKTADILQLYANFYGEWDPRRGSYRFQSLERAGKQCGIALPNSHRAKADALLTRALLHYMAEQG